MELQVGVKVLLRRADGRFLLLYKPRLAAWDIPGGRIAPNENLMAALRREVLEEIGVELAGTPQLVAAQDIFPKQKNLHVVRLTYLHTMDIASVTLSDEHEEYRWANAAEMRDMNIEPYLHGVIEQHA